MRWLILALVAAWPLNVAAAETPWLALPATPVLPAPVSQGNAPVDGISLWYATFGRAEAPSVLLLHGGLANSNYWGKLVPALAPYYRVVVIDSRGHGRSSRNATPIGYELMARDAVGLLDRLDIQRTAVVGWSDGAITGLELALHDPDRLRCLFAFAANSDPSGVKDVRQSPVFSAFITRAGQEYARLSPTPGGYAAFDADIEKMWASQPTLTAADLRRVRVPTWIVDGDRDEAIKRENTDFMAATIPGAGELILPRVSHFAFLQDAEMFNLAVLHFLGQCMQ